MKHRITRLISMVLLGIGICLMLYPKLRLLQSEKTNYNLLDVVWDMMEEGYVDLELGLSEGGVIDAYSGIEEANLAMARQEYELLVRQTSEEEDMMSFDEKKEWLVSQKMAYGIIEIPKLEAYYAVVKGSGKKNIQIAIGHMRGTAHFGQVGNCILVGQQGEIQGEFFDRIDELMQGDLVLVTNMKKQKFIYEVYEQGIISKEESQVIEPDGTKKELTLISYDGENHRQLVIRCRLVES